jgi:GMP synthase (glutamine-hydrolysing)
MPQPTIAILDFGAQYVQLIARRVRENQVHSLIFAPDTPPEKLREHNVIGVILSGGPSSAYAKGAPQPHAGIFDMNLPILGICYGMQAACLQLGGKVSASAVERLPAPHAWFVPPRSDQRPQTDFPSASDGTCSVPTEACTL